MHINIVVTVYIDLVLLDYVGYASL